MRKIAAEEIKNSLMCRECAKKDNRLGFHGEAFGYIYTPAKIDRKVKMVREMLKKMPK
jgi:hypothetical protein